MENYVGKRLDGRYEIIEIIGVGGMAVVYKAFDNIDNRIVAVKILKDEYISNEDFRRRFKNESKAIAVLSHPNIVKIYDVSYGDLLQYIVMEYVDGITLKEYIEQQGVVDTREAVYFVTQILRALQHAHDKGIVHRDIKPQNIMLVSDGTIKVTDFGIARMSRSETKTMTGEAIGSVHYISPEQVKGGVTDAKADIYSVGVVLYEMLTGKLPFESDNTAQLILMQIQKNPEMPRKINPNIPVGLEQIIIRAMQKSQKDRYQSSSEMLMDIERYKQNPNIKFDYSYFVDKEPTKYIKTPETVSRQPIRTQQEKKEPVAVRKEPVKKTAKPNKDDRATKRSIGILIGALSALVILAVIIVMLVIPDKGKIPVPDLLGKNFAEEVMNSDEYSMFNFEVVNDTESDEKAGTIISQNPNHGKIERGGTIKLSVAAFGKEVEVPDVYGYEYTSAQTLLKSKNFNVVIEKEQSKTVESGNVIRTSPRRGEKTTPGSTIKLFVATEDVKEKVDVPNLMGMTISEAKKALEAKGLELDSSRTEYRSSSEARGKIIGYESLGEQVEVGTKIAVYVSTGLLPEETTTKNETTTEKPSTTVKPTESKPTKAPEPTTKAPVTAKPTESTAKAPDTTTKAPEKPSEAPENTKPTNQKVPNSQEDENNGN